MLIITRKRREKIIIADNIEITILDIGRKIVRFGIQAPKEIPIRSQVIRATAPEGETKPAVIRATAPEGETKPAESHDGSES
jgi:carbon storage regulator CsrA